MIKLPKMKAYLIKAIPRNEYNISFKTVVFAESNNKARALGLKTDTFSDNYEYTELRALRIPDLDNSYRGRFEMDWYNTDDRVDMVRYGNFQCGEDWDITVNECEACPANKWCKRYERMKEDEVV